MRNAHRQSLTILIAEDDDGHAELIQDNLQDAGVTDPVVRFRDGQEALDFLLGEPDSGNTRRSGAPYLLLLDIRMPRANGIEVLRQVKAAPQTRMIPVIMLTTTDDPIEIRHCYELGCSLYITKPVDYQRFDDMIHRLGQFLKVIQIPEQGSQTERTPNRPCAE